MQAIAITSSVPSKAKTTNYLIVTDCQPLIFLPGVILLPHAHPVWGFFITTLAISIKAFGPHYTD